jgi:rhodanese-related sulfurtransferase
MLKMLFGKTSSKSISPSKAKERLTVSKDILLIDVRTPEEYREIHILNSISLPLNQLKTGISKIAKNKDTEIIVYCLSGVRASHACSQLVKMGYTNVSNMGSIESWKYETERG